MVVKEGLKKMDSRYYNAIESNPVVAAVKDSEGLARWIISKSIPGRMGS